MGDYEILKGIVCMFLRWNPMSEEVKKIPHYMWPIYYRMHNFTMLQTYEMLYRPQGELIGSISNPEVYKHYYEAKQREFNLKKEGGPKTYTVTEGGVTSSSSTADTYFDPEKGLVDFEGKVLISKDAYLSRQNDGGLFISQ